MTNTFEIRPLGEIAEFVNGRAFKPEEWGTKGLPIIRIQNLTGFSEDFNYFNGDFDERYLVKNDDLLISWSASLGVYRWQGDNAVLNQHIFKVNLKDGVEKTFFYYVMQTKLAEMAGETHGSTMKHITKDRFDRIKIPLPPLPIQKQIAAILEKADGAREKRRQANRLTEQFLQSAFLEMFGDPATNPKGWERKTFNALCDIRRGASPRPIDKFMGGTVPWIKISDGSDYSSLYIQRTAAFVNDEGAKKSVFVPAGSLIFANCGVSLGFARILRIGGCIHDGWLALSNIRPEVNEVYLLSVINMLTDYFRRIAPGGTQPNLNTTILGNTLIPVPPIKKQEEFKEMIQKVESLRAKQRESEKQLDNLFNSLMQRAFRGELRPPLAE